MNILYYFEPWLELGRPNLRYHNLRYQMGPQIRALKASGEVNIQIAIGEGTLHRCQADQYDFEGCPVTILTQVELKSLTPNYLTSAAGLFRREEPLSSLFASYLAIKLGDFVPDFVISFLAPLPNLKFVWPNSSILYAEFGMFSRAPYPRTFYFDTQGMFAQSSIRIHAQELLEFSATDAELRLVADFREGYLRSFYKQHPILDQVLITAAEGFKYKVLLPLQFSDYFGFDCCSQYADQFEYLTDVLNNISPEVGVFVTEHSGWPEVITENNIEYLRHKYPNLLWSPRISKIRAASQYLMTEVQGVISVSSSIGMQCMMWDMPLFSPWDSHLRDFSQVQSLVEVTPEKIASFIPGMYDRAVLAVLTRYYLTEDVAYNGIRFRKYLNQAHAGSQATTFEQRFKPLGTVTEIFNSLRESFREVDGHKLYLQDIGEELDSAVLSINDRVPDDFKQQVDALETLSFDLFDTLVDRPFAAPHEIFLYMQDEVRRITGDRTLEFHKIRRYAEHRARQLTSRNEISIDEIYEIFFKLTSIDQAFKHQLIDLEFEYELRFCRRRAQGAALYEYAVAAGKKIIVISDFYYGQTRLRQMIDGLGYDRVSKIYVSIDYLESKHHGELFKKVIAEGNVYPERTLHVGDNHTSDIINAGSYGFKTYWVPKAIYSLTKQPVADRLWNSLLDRTVFPSERVQIGQSIFFGLVARNLFDQLDSPKRDSFGMGRPKDFGFVVLGPMLFGFTQWLVEQLIKKNTDAVFFLARDGRLFNHAYDLFREVIPDLPQSKYLLSSRRAFGLAAVKTIGDAQDLIAIPFEPTSLATIFQSRFGFELEDKNCPSHILEAAEITSFTVKVHPVHDVMRLKKLVSLLFPAISAQAEQERTALLFYLNTVGFNNSTTPAVVDIGYAGTLQHYLSKLVQCPNLSGYYFMTHAKAADYKASGLDIYAYFRENVEHHLKRDLLSLNVSLFELLLSSSEASLTYFELLDNGLGVMAKSKSHVHDPRRDRLITQIQAGALEFIKQALSYVGREHTKMYLSSDFATLHLLDFVARPSRQDALLFNNLKAEDTFSAKNSRFIVSDIVGMMQKHPKLTKEQAKKLIKDSEWTVGATAILPQKATVSKMGDIKTNSTSIAKKYQLILFSNMPKFLNRIARLYRKLRRDPYQYLADSHVPGLKILKYFFK